MRMLLVFDLPSVEKVDISNNQKFVKNLKKIGFYMLQYSIYCKCLTNQSDFERTYVKLRQIIPDKGNIALFRLTEKQFDEMVYLNGEKTKYDLLVGSKNVVFFGGNND